jgi:hypothetical protein
MRWIIAAALGLAAFWLSTLNWIALVRRFSSRGYAPSWIPLVGGVLGLAALLLAPSLALRRFWWVALVVDGGSIPGLAATLGFTLYRRASRGR